ncbi:MAG: lyase family protein, partial [Patescibacteria group bacterium]
ALKGLHGSLAKTGRAALRVPLLSLTHGQPATPTTAGKEFLVFADRLDRQIAQLRAFRMQGKLGGAVGNFAAHKAAYPDVHWERFRAQFVKGLGLTPLAHTTQINPHDDLAELSHLFFRVNTILLDYCRDMWLYISRGVFRQKAVAGEVGSSTMPHKVNPIDFENAEGNLGLANALFGHFASKLPVSRLQRDLSDSTVQRNLGVAFGYHLLAIRSIERGLKKVTLDRAVLKRELADHPEVLAEAVQTLLRKHGVPGAYEKLKTLTRGEKVTREKLLHFVEGLPLTREEKARLKAMA